MKFIIQNMLTQISRISFICTYTIQTKPILIKSTFFIALLCQMTIAINGQEQNSTDSLGLEEKEIISDPVNFRNQTYKRALPEHARANIVLGQKLGKKIMNTPDFAKVSLSGIHIKRIINNDFSVNPSQLGADVLTIEPWVHIGHINVLHRILTGYIKNIFLYNQEDAKTLARYLLYYNASQYKKINYIKKRYIPKVLKYIEQKKPGISKNYSNWGKETAILIPLKGTFVYPKSGDLVREEIRPPIETNNHNDNTDTEQNKLSQLEDRRKQDHSKRIKEKKKQIKQEQKRLMQDQEQISKEKDTLLTKKKQNQQQIEQLNKNKSPETQNAIEQLQQENQNLNQSLDEVTAQEDANQLETAKNQKQQTGLEEEAKAVATNDPIASRDLTSQQPSPISSQQSQQETGGILGPQSANQSAPILDDGKQLIMKEMRPTEKGHFQNQLAYYDRKNKQEGIKSDFKNICSRNYFIIKGVGVLVTGYEGAHDNPENQEQHNLVLLSEKNLQMINTSKENIFWRTPFYFKSDHIYVFLYPENKNFYLARFSKSLQLDAKSILPINPNSKLQFDEANNQIIITSPPQSKKKKRLILAIDTLDIIELSQIDSE